MTFNNHGTRWIYCILFMCVALLTGCVGSFTADYGRQILRVNEDLSGTFTRGMALSDYDWNQAAMYYNDGEPSDAIARSIAQNMEWLEFTHVYYQEGGYHWVEVTTEFASPDELFVLIESVTSDKPEGSGGSGSESDLPYYDITREDGFFQDTYHLQGTLLPLGNTGAAYEATYYAQLPGEIVETNGRILENNMVAWDWGYYDFVPYKLTTRVPNTTNIVLTVVWGIGILVGVGVWWAKKQQQSPKLSSEQNLKETQ